MGALAARAAARPRGALQTGLERLCGPPSATERVAPEEIDIALRAIAEADDGPSLSRYLEREGTLDQMHEFLVHRSAYQLKEADPHAWAIPRLSGPPKAALVEIEADEFGGGRAERVHATLFAEAMAAVGLDARYGAYLDHIPALTLATVNLMSLPGCTAAPRGDRRAPRAVRDDLVGAQPALRQRAAPPGLRQRGGHGVLRRARRGRRGARGGRVGRPRRRPGPPGAARSRGDLLWGARTLAAIEARWAENLLAAWDAGDTSLRIPLAEPARAG